jgi:hypothetical protein
MTASSSSKTRLLVTVDTEEAWDWSGPFPRSGYSVEHIHRLPEFQAICDRHNIRTTYFANHAVMSDRGTSAVMAAMAKRENVEVGMHIHPWTVSPSDLKAEVKSRETYLHNAPVQTIREKLQFAYDAFQGSNIRPVSFRGGRYSTGEAIQTFLMEKGFVADSSIVPYTRWMDDGAPDFSRRGVFPVRIAPRANNAQGLWEIPLSMGFTRKPFGFWAALYDTVEHSPLSRLRLIGLAERLNLVRRVWLNFDFGSDRDWGPFIDVLQSMQVPCITLTVHSSALFRGPGPYTRRASDEIRMHELIDRVLSRFAGLPCFESATVAEAATLLESGGKRETVAGRVSIAGV